MHIFGSTTLKQLLEEGLINVRTKNACNYVGIETVDDIVEFINQKGSLYSIPRLGKKSVTEINSILDLIQVDSTLQSTPKKTITRQYNIKTSRIVKEIFNTEKIDGYVVSCLSVPILKKSDAQNLRLELDYNVISTWSNIIKRVIGKSNDVITDYFNDHFYRWYGLDLLQLICFEPNKLLDTAPWPSLEEHVIFLQKTLQIFRSFISWLIKNNYYKFIDIVRCSFKDFELCIDDYLEENCETGFSFKKTTNEYYHVILEEVNNKDILDNAKVLAPDFYEAIYLSTLSFEDFSNLLRFSYEISGNQTKDLYALFQNLRDQLADILSIKNEEIEYKIFSKKWPFIDSDTFVIDFKRDNSHYPMFYLLKKALIESNDRSDNIYCEYYGIGCIRNTSLESLAKKFNTSRATIQNILKRVPKVVNRTNIIIDSEWDSYKVLQDSVIEENISGLDEIIEKEKLAMSSDSLVEGLFSLHNEYSVFAINGYSYYFKKQDFPDVNPIEGLKQLKALEKSGSREAQTVYMFSLFGDHDFNNWAPFSIISLIIEQEIGFILENNEYIEIDARFDSDALLVELLESNKKPMLLNEITNRFNAKSPDLKLSTDSVRIKLNRIPEVITLGKSGYYALNYWTDIYTGSIRDLIVEVMDEYGKPISLSTIITRVKEFFPTTNERSVESSLKMSQTHYTFTHIGNLYFCSQVDRENIYKDKLAELNPPSEDNRIAQMKDFLLEKRRFPLRLGCTAEASLRDWIHRVLIEQITLSTENLKEFRFILAHYLDDDPDEPSNIFSIYKSNELLDSFFSRDLDNKLLVDKEFESDITQKQDMINYIISICNIPFKDFIDYISKNRTHFKWNSSDITQNSNIDDCHRDLCKAIIEQGNLGFDYLSLGMFLLNDGIVRNDLAYRKYGENHVKSAQQLGLVFERKGLWYLTSFGLVFKEIEQGLQSNFMARILLRNPFYANIVSDASMHQIQISSYLESLSESTRIRRIPSVRKMLNIIINACDVKEKVYYRLFDAINDKSRLGNNNLRSEDKEIGSTNKFNPELEYVQGDIQLVAEDIDAPKTNAEMIVEYLANHPNVMAKDIAKALNIEKKIVNSCLYTTLSKKVKQDKNYKWSLI